MKQEIWHGRTQPNMKLAGKKKFWRVTKMNNEVIVLKFNIEKNFHIFCSLRLVRTKQSQRKENCAETRLKLFSSANFHQYCFDLHNFALCGKTLTIFLLKRKLFLHVLIKVNIYHLIFGPCRVHGAAPWSVIWIDFFRLAHSTNSQHSLCGVLYSIVQARATLKPITFPPNSVRISLWEILFFIVIKSFFFRLPCDYNRFGTHSTGNKKEILKSHTQAHSFLTSHKMKITFFPLNSHISVCVLLCVDAIRCDTPFNKFWCKFHDPWFGWHHPNNSKMWCP